MRRIAAGGVALAIVPPHVLGGPEKTPPSNVLTHGTIGCGGMGVAGHIVANAEGRPPVQLAVCDVHKGRLAAGMAKAARSCTAYTDWRHVIDRRDIDIIHVPTPPHWHALITLAAVQAGKDVFCEKPFTRTIDEGQKLVEAVERHGRIVHVNVHGRSAHNGDWLLRLVELNLLGWPLTVRVDTVGMITAAPNPPVRPAPPDFDYDMWLGPAPWRPFCGVERYNFRAYWDYDSGAMGDFGQHHFDPVQMALGKDGEFPIEVEASAPPQDPFVVGRWHWIRVRYADGTMVLFDGEQPCPGLDRNVIAQGPKGRFYKDQGVLKSDPPGLAERLRAMGRQRKWLTFDEAVRTRNFASGAKPNAAAAHHSCTVVNMGTIAVRVGRTLRFDAGTQRFINDDAANALAQQPMRAPWRM
jgi:predicted dehydrogenase